ncbi:MAG: LysR family transcriptional regulator [Devosia sp.]
MGDRLAEMETFVRVVDTNSFSAAARALGTSQSRVSKSIAALENRLDARLLSRTTRHLSLTDAGGIYYRQCKAVLTAVEEAETSARLGQHAVTGRLRVNAAAILALSLVQPALLAFRNEHPELAIDITMDDRRVDPVQEGVDLIVRVGVLKDSGLVLRKVGTSTLGFYASPRYLKRSMPIARLADLKDHALISLPERQSQRGYQIGDEEGGTVLQAWSRSVTVSNFLLAHAAAMAGAGIAVLPRFLAEADVTAGRLSPLLPSARLPAIEINFLHPFGQRAPRKVAAFMDFAIARWRESGELLPAQ